MHKHFFIICIAGLLAVCNRQAALRETAMEPEYRKISSEEARNMMSSSKNFILLDVRTEAEYREKRIAGSVLIPNTEISSRAGKELPDKAALILVYCGSGGRSAAASRELVNMGYSNVYDFGGISSWPYQTVSD